MTKQTDQRNDQSGKMDEAATLRTLNSFAVDLISIPTVEDLFWYVAQNVVGRLNFIDCVIYQANDAQTELVQVAALGEKNPFGRSIINPLRIPFGKGITGQVAVSREAIVRGDLREDQDYITDTRRARSEICVPIVCGNRIAGVIDSEHADADAFGPAELEVLITIAALTGAKLVQLAEADRSKRRYHDLVEAHAQLSQEATNRRALEAELFTARKLEAVGRLTGKFAHEFNNLLTVISGNLEFLEEDIPQGAPAETLGAAQAAARRGGEVIQSMLTFSRRTRLSPEIADLNHFVQTFCADVRNVPPEVVRLSLAEDIAQISVDLSVLRSVIEHLVANACDALRDGGIIHIETRNIIHSMPDIRQFSSALAPGHYVRLSVSDNGVGIGQQDLQQIFDPFFTTKPVGEGTGLGLSMVLGFMQQSGGTVEVQTEVGKGSTFHLYFPAEPEAARLC